MDMLLNMSPDKTEVIHDNEQLQRGILSFD